MLLNCGVGEDFLRVPWTERRSNQSILKESVLNIHWKDWCWSWNSNTLATWFEELTHQKRPWCWEILKAGERDSRGWDGWMASLTQWTWVWASSKSWWWTGRPGVLWSLGSQSDMTEQLNWTHRKCGIALFKEKKRILCMSADLSLCHLHRKTSVRKYSKKKKRKYSITQVCSYLGNPMDRRNQAGLSLWGHKELGHNWLITQ